MASPQFDYQSERSLVQVGNGGVSRRWLTTSLIAIILGAHDFPRASAGDNSVKGTEQPAARSGNEGGSTPSAGQDGIRAEARVALKPTSPSDTRTGGERNLTDTLAPTIEETPIDRALRMISECKTRFQDVTDYSCDFYKRERINGRLTELHVMSMKERTLPKSIYFKFQQPHRGREAIYVHGSNSGYILAHDVGFTKFLTGTMELDPKGARAMENNRHPITEAGIGELINTVERRWTRELNPKHSVINHYDEIVIGPHKSVSMIESIHPVRHADFMYYKVKVYINQEVGLPIRFEAFDWPKTASSPADLVEEYTYLNLKLNVGLKDRDFDPANEAYSFGRF